MDFYHNPIVINSPNLVLSIFFPTSSDFWLNCFRFVSIYLLILCILVLIVVFFSRYFCSCPLPDKQLPYSVSITTSDPNVLPQPKLNISRTGTIPTEIETFSVDLLCSGLTLAEVDVTINIQVTLNRATNNVTELIFRRKKICYM